MSSYPLPLIAILSLLAPSAPIFAEPPPSAVADPQKANRMAAQAALKHVINRVGGRASPTMEREIRRDPDTVRKYLDYLGNPRIAELEQVLLTNSQVAADYAMDILCSRWPEAEKTIATNPAGAAYYANRILCRPWPEAEKAIFSRGDTTAWYAEKFPHRITPEARRLMESDPWGAALTAETEGRRRAELEPVILKSPGAACHYAATVIKGRWPEAEAGIAADAWAAVTYAASVIKTRWLPGEGAIVRDADALCDYLNIKGVDWPFGAMTLAVASVTSPDAAWLSDALCRDPEAWAVLGRRAGLRARVWMIRGARADDLRRAPIPDAEEFSGDADAALFFATTTGRRFPAGEPVILKSPPVAARYAEAVLKARWPEAEPAIARHGEAAMHYARDVLKRRWPEAEPAIVNHPGAASEYAVYVLRSPWPEGESAIASTAYGAFRYASSVLKSRWPAAEPVIARSGNAASYATQLMAERWPEGEFAMTRGIHGCAEYAERFRLRDWPEACEVFVLNQPLWLDGVLEKLPRRPRPGLGALILETRAAGAACAYAKHVIGGRWPEAEPLILTKPYCAAAYAAEVVNARWPQAEPVVLADPESAAAYAIRVIKARWPQAEPVVLREWQAAKDYANALVTTRWPEGESTLSSVVSSDLISYCANIAKMRVPAAEAAILAGNSPEQALAYAKQVVHGRWPEAEELIGRDSRCRREYAVLVSTMHATDGQR